MDSWHYSRDHAQLCKIIESQTLWGESTCRVWLPGSDSVVRVSADSLISLEDAAPKAISDIPYVCAAAKVADALTHDVLLAPIESSVIPLPHQIQALSRATANDRVRYLLADEVGLGKTIEAGLIQRELKLRGLVARTLVVAPKGLVTQWAAEMDEHFGEDFRVLIPGDFSTYRRIAAERNIWKTHNQVICPMDSVKPLDSRKGWSSEQIARFNQDRFEDLTAAGWDLIIVDEAHRLGGSTDQVARYKLGQGLAEASPYLLLLSATPHQGKTDAFRRIVSLLDSEAFPDISSITRDRVQPYVIRTEKRRAIKADGGPLFKPRRTELAPVSWEDRHQDQKILYHAVTEYVRKGYNQALKTKRSYIGFLMILMQRLVSSSVRAVRTTLERRLEALNTPQVEQIPLFPIFSEEEWADLDGQEQIEALLAAKPTALDNERTEVEHLLMAARQCEDSGLDAKAEALLDWIYRLQQDEGDPELKILVFTEFVPTQEMLNGFLRDRGFSTVCLNGSMDMEERKRVQEAFAGDARILISTDAGGEGLNLQFCHIVINYDIPWNPMRLEQRIGRVDRIGQPFAVRAINFVFNNSVEHRVREVLEQKLEVILEEFGIDKTGDVLDSAQAGRLFDDLYAETILHPSTLESSIDDMTAQLHEQIRETQAAGTILGGTEDLDPDSAQRLLTHPLPHWVERMTVNYLDCHGGNAEKIDGAWNLTWPNGDETSNVVFSRRDGEQNLSAKHLTMDDPKVRGLAMSLPRFAPGQPVPCVSIPDLSDEIQGYWSLWKISIRSDDWNKERIMPLFIHDDGRSLIPTARHIWDELLMVSLELHGYVFGEPAKEAYEESMGPAEVNGESLYNELMQAHKERIRKEHEKGEYAFAARRRLVERVGLPEVRNYRLTQLEVEERNWRQSLRRKAQVSPEMTPLIFVRLGGDGYCE